MRLRSTLKLHQTDILEMTADISDTRRQFVQSLEEKVNEVNTMSASYGAPPSMIQLVAIDIDRKSVCDIFQQLQFPQSEKLANFLEQILQGNSWDNLAPNDSDEDDTNTIAAELGFVTKTHITLAHYRDMSQAGLQSIYTPYIDSSVECSTNAIYYNEHIMALAIKNNERNEIMTSDGTILPISSPSSLLSGSQPERSDTFLHLTIWCSKGESAYKANTLPSLVKDNKAWCVEFPEQILQGNISFWYM